MRGRRGEEKGRGEGRVVSTQAICTLSNYDMFLYAYANATDVMVVVPLPRYFASIRSILLFDTSVQTPTFMLLHKACKLICLCLSVTNKFDSPWCLHKSICARARVNVCVGSIVHSIYCR